MTKTWMLAAIAAAGLSAMPAGAVTVATTVKVYDNITPTSSQYVNYLTGKGYGVGYLTTGFAAADIAGLNMVILSGLNTVSAQQVLALRDYVAGGGRLFVLSDGFNANNAPIITTFNTIALGVGSAIVDDTTAQDPAPYRTTTAITAGDPFTTGVANVNYLFTSGLSGGTTIVKGVSGQNLVSYQSIGQGLFVGSADLTIGQVLGDGYGNDRLMLNLLSVAIPAATALPEPASWAMMIGGFGVIGYAMRRRRVAVRIRAA